jgi:competence protein ComEC
MAKQICFSSVNEAIVYKSYSGDSGKEVINRYLLGTYIEVLEDKGEWLKIKVLDNEEGFIKKSDTTDKAGFRCFYADVGQGDGMLIEVGDIKMIVDGGKNQCLKTFMNEWKFKYAREENAKVHIDHLFITHLDDDHFAGLIDLMNDPNYTFGTIHFAGIVKFKKDAFNTSLGNKVKKGDKYYLETIFNNFDEIGPVEKLNNNIKNFILAVKSKGAVKSERLEAGKLLIDKKVEGNDFKIEVLGPITEKLDGKPYFLYFKDESHTINGHSLVLKLTFGKFTMLLGADLNEISQDYLLNNSADGNKFKADVYKVGHHGAADFSVDFLKNVAPKAAVFSSGDNDTYGHPSSIAIGCVGKYSSSMKPLVFSTELARSYDKGTILYGTIFLRSNGNQTFMSQMKEGGHKSDPWESYEVK